jgi:hypothetical protein
MTFELRECYACSGDTSNWNPLCGGCGRWVLFAEQDGHQYAAPYVEIGTNTCAVGWDHRPTDAEVEQARAELTAGLTHAIDVTPRPIGHTVRLSRPKQEMAR